MLGIIIIVGAIIGLIAIYYVKLEETQKKDKLRVTMDIMTSDAPAPQMEAEEPVRKQNLDLRAVHSAYSKAEILYSQKNYDEALKAYVYVLSLHPENLEAINKLGLIYLTLRRLNRAVSTFRQLNDLSEESNPVYLSNLGLALFTQGQLNEARMYYEKAIALDNSKVNRFISLAQVCVDLKDWKAAINNYSRAIEMEPKNLELYFIVTDLLVKLSAFTEAQAFMEALLESNPYNEEAKERVREIKILKGTNPLSNKDKSEKETEAATHEEDEDQQSLF